MEAITLPIYNTEGKEIDTLKLSPGVFDGTINSAAIYQAINAFRACQRKGLAATKTRGEVSGGGRKPWRQKGTGRARVGSTRSPLWRHGGVVFGPHQRDFSYKLPSKIKNLALKSTLNIKAQEKDLIILENIKIDKPKTKEVAKIFSRLKIISKKDRKPSSALLLLKKADADLKLAGRNLDFLDINIARDTHAYEVLSHKKIMVTKDGLDDLIKRLK
jgi:large subunit ribosomal protein L4